MNKIVFTQDVLGEREWLSSIFPRHKNFETEFSGLWPTKLPSDQGVDAIWEIPPDSRSIVVDCPGEKILSLYQLNLNFISRYWTQSDSFINRNIEFKRSSRSPYAQVVTFNRCGTMFLESILFNKAISRYTYNKEWVKVNQCPWTGKQSHHANILSANPKFYDFVREDKPDIFVIYRDNWWDWFTSMIISIKYKQFWHYDSEINFDDLTPITVNDNDLNEMNSFCSSHWNAICHFRTLFPNLNFYIVNFSTLVEENQKLTSHNKVSYSKKQLIENYDQVKEIFVQNYQDIYSLYEQRSVRHLKNMNCTQVDDLKLILND